MDYTFKDMNYGLSGKVQNSWLSATEAHKMACDSCSSKDNEQMTDIMQKIYANAKKGEIKLYYDNLRANVINKLTELGYEITHSPDQRDGDYCLIEW